MSSVIEVENLGKKYIISHQTQEQYTALRDVIAEGAKKIFRTKKQAEPKREEFWALRDVTFAVNQGDKIGVIGRNGAGKTTLLKVLSRITAPSIGRIKLKGKVSSLLEVGTGFHPELTGRENIFLNGAILGLSRNEIKKKFRQIVEFAETEKFLDTPVKRYSSGMYVRLAFAISAHLEPEILIVDEVLAVGDIQFQKKCLGRMNQIGKEGRTVLFVSHNMAAVENLCDQCILLDKGRIIMQDDTKKVIRYYIEDLLPRIYDSEPLSLRSNRSGNGIVKFTYFHIEDKSGTLLPVVRSGMDIVLVFGYKCDDVLKVKNVDIGFSIHSYDNYALGGLYSSHMDKLFNINCQYGEFRFKIHKLALAEGKYTIGARIVVNSYESDWPRDGIGFLDVESGDFYGTGKRGFDSRAPILFDGEWLLREIRDNLINEI